MLAHSSHGLTAVSHSKATFFQTPNIPKEGGANTVLHTEAESTSTHLVSISQSTRTFSLGPQNSGIKAILKRM